MNFRKRFKNYPMTAIFLAAAIVTVALVMLLSSCDHRKSCGNAFGAVGHDMHRHLVEDDTHEIRHCHNDGDVPHQHDWKD